jgi:hypothetical protein
MRRASRTFDRCPLRRVGSDQFWAEVKRRGKEFAHRHGLRRRNWFTRALSRRTGNRAYLDTATDLLRSAGFQTGLERPHSRSSAFPGVSPR